ncbi:Nsp1-like C-terminal region-domain-containing protein [Lactarius akahatsu]|uniref:Nsp1-like C-terminal region-domain-containing protein n=1 Tax=Lactarius akahatsu TaxID=416441 RepID=A0AAD4QC94_9AGAM|nr:Nsp1-like C-terminal region-domain-containing protein [Lactarius akahatsu]
MSSNFGAGQNLFAAAANQNKDQNPSTSGPTPAANSGLFGNLGANTTGSTAFGGTGSAFGATGASAGNAGAPGTTGGFPGTGGSVFGGANANANPGTNTGSAFGGPGLFSLKPAGTTASSGAPAGGALFGNPGASTTATGNLFGNTTGTNTGNTGASSFGFPAPKPATTSGGIFSSGLSGPGSTNASGPSGGLFGGATAPTGSTGTSTVGGSNTAAPTSTSTNPLGGNIFGGAKPADNATKPATPNLFGAPGTGTNSSTGTTGTATLPAPSAAPFGSIPGGSLFTRPQGTGTAATTPAANTQTQPAFSLGGATSTGDKTASTAATTTGGGFFGGLGATVNKDGKPEEKKDGATTTTLPTFSLGGPPASTTAAPTEKRDGAAPPLFSGMGSAPKSVTPLGGSTSAAPSAGIVATSTTSAISVPPPSMLKGKSIEEIVNRWSTELEIHVRDFNKFAAEVAVWDRSLIENGNNLAALYNYVLAAEREQNDIDQSLEHIEQQEKELTTIVETYEKQMADILGGQGGNLRTLDTGPADTERDKNYMLATELHNHLDDLSSSLTQLIESVNSMSVGQGNTKPTPAEDPMAQIAQVLSNHLESLQWIDGASRELEEKVGEVEKRIKDVSGVPHGTPVPGGSSRSRGFGLTR